MASTVQLDLETGAEATRGELARAPPGITGLATIRQLGDLAAHASGVLIGTGTTEPTLN